MTATGTTEPLQGRLRPMDPVRDLGAIAELATEAFAADLDERGRAALRELRWMARLTPLTWWWYHADPEFREAFGGFVWEEPVEGGKGRIVGSANLNRAPGDEDRYIVCNVVVRGAYRRRGIGRKLTEAAIAEARKRGAKGVVIQVHEDNAPALQLYSHLGFREVAAEVELRLEAIQPVAVLDSPGYHVRPWRPADGPASLELARLVTPQVWQWLRPLRPEQYAAHRLADWRRRLTDRLGGRRVYRLAALHEEQLVALLTVTVALRRGEHRLALLVHPDHAGRLEAALVSRALHTLAAAPRKAVRAAVNREEKSLLAVLRDYGFQARRTLLTMSQDFQS